MTPSFAEDGRAKTRKISNKKENAVGGSVWQRPDLPAYERAPLAALNIIPEL